MAERAAIIIAEPPTSKNDAYFDVDGIRPAAGEHARMKDGRRSFRGNGRRGEQLASRAIFCFNAASLSILETGRQSIMISVVLHLPQFKTSFSD